MSIEEKIDQVPVYEGLKYAPQEFGLNLEHGDTRRDIYKIVDVDVFLNRSKELQIDSLVAQKIAEYFERYPDATKQFFVSHAPAVGEQVRLGDHHHTQVKEGGSGEEIFIFTDIPPETNITLEQYELGGVPRGRIMPGVQTGTIMRNDPHTHHIFTSNGSFSMVQVLEGGFKPNDLNSFKPSEWAPEEQRLVEGETTRDSRLWNELVERKMNEYTEKYPDSFEILSAGGVHPEHTEPISNPYLNGELDTEDFRNVGEHCVAVAMCAQQLATELHKIGVISQEQSHEIVARALIHDANKRFEVFRKKAQKVGVLDDVYSVQAYENIQKILGDHVSPELVSYLVEAGKETGHTSMKDFVRLDSSGEIVLNPESSLAEMIVHIADDMVASPIPGKTYNRTTQIVPVAERMRLGDFQNRYAFLYQEGFGFDAAGKPQLVRDASKKEEVGNLFQTKTYAEWQKIVAGLIAEELKKNIDPKNTQDSQKYIAQLAGREVGI